MGPSLFAWEVCDEEAYARHKEEQYEQALKPKQTFKDVVERAKLILPQILNDKAWSDQERINMPEMMKLLKISQNTAYRVRKELLKNYHEQKDLRDEQWRISAKKDISSSQQP